MPVARKIDYPIIADKGEKIIYTVPSWNKDKALTENDLSGTQLQSLILICHYRIQNQ